MREVLLPRHPLRGIVRTEAPAVGLATVPMSDVLPKISRRTMAVRITVTAMVSVQFPAPVRTRPAFMQVAQRAERAADEQHVDPLETHQRGADVAAGFQEARASRQTPPPPPRRRTTRAARTPDRTRPRSPPVWPVSADAADDRQDSREDERGDRADRRPHIPPPNAAIPLSSPKGLRAQSALLITMVFLAVSHGPSRDALATDPTLLVAAEGYVTRSEGS